MLRSDESKPCGQRPVRCRKGREFHLTICPFPRLLLIYLFTKARTSGHLGLRPTSIQVRVSPAAFCPKINPLFPLLTARYQPITTLSNGASAALSSDIMAEQRGSVLCHCVNCQKSSGSSFQANLFCRKEVR